MNASVRVLTPGAAFVGNSSVSWQLPDLKVLVLIFLVIVSAFGLIYIKDFNRRLFIDSHQLQVQSEQLQSDSSKLLLEYGAWAAQARVQQVAQQQLHMQIPMSTEVIMIKA